MKKWRVLSHFLHLECSFFLQYTVIICRADCLVSHGSSLWRLQIQEDCNTHCTFPWFWGFTLWFSSTYLLTYLLTYLTYLFHMCCCAVVRRQPWGVGFPLLWVSEETGLTSSGLAASVFTYSPISLPDQVCCKKKKVCLILYIVVILFIFDLLFIGRWTIMSGTLTLILRALWLYTFLSVAFWHRNCSDISILH